MQDCVWRQGWRPQNPEWGIYHLQAVCHLDKKFNFSDIRFIYLRNVVGIKYGTVLRVWHSACDIASVPEWQLLFCLQWKRAQQGAEGDRVVVGRRASQSSPEKQNQQERGPSVCFILFFFSWRIIALQYCVDFCHISA